VVEQRDVWLSEYGADCFDVSNVDRTEVDRVWAAGRWFPLYLNDELIGHVQIDYDGSTTTVIRALKGNKLEVRPDPDSVALWERLNEADYGSDEYRELKEQLEKLDEEIQERRSAA
jgi:hypothetical protein